MDNGWTEEVEVVFGPEVQRGPQEPCLVGLKGESRGLLYRLPQGDTLVGRERSLAQLVLSAAGVSRAHARLFHHEDGRVTVSDLGSTNGTFVNGEKIEEKELRDGDSKEIQVTVSIGVTLISPNRTMEKTLAAADSALYRAKQAGRNRVETFP